MAKQDEPGLLESLTRRQPWLLWIWWAVLCVLAAYALLYAGYAEPTLYEGF